MSKSSTRARVRTAAALKADARLLSGEKSRIALAEDTSGAEPSNTGTVGELWLYGVVGGWWRGFDAESVSNALRNLDVDTLYVRVHSPGGRASDGVAIGNLLRNHRAHIVVVVDGLAASAASVIAIAGDEVVMCPGSQMMLHDASIGTWGNAAQLRRDADWLDGQSNNYAGVYAHKAGGTPEQWREVMLANEGEGTYYTAAEAVTAGLADEVGNRIAVGSPPVAPEDEIDEDDDDLLARVEHDLQLLEQHVHASARAAWQGGTFKPPTASAGGSTHTEGGSAVAFTTEQITTLRDKLELPADADEAAILAAVAAVVDESLEDRPAPEANASTVPEGHVVVPKAKLDDLESGATAGRQAAEKLHAMEREAFLDKNKAKFAATNRGAWAKEYDRDPEGTKAHFAQAPDLVPVNELGHEADGVERDEASASTSLEDVRNSDAYKNWRM